MLKKNLFIIDEPPKDIYLKAPVMKQIDTYKVTVKQRLTQWK